MSKLFSSKGSRAEAGPDYRAITFRVVIALVVLIVLLLNVFTYLLNLVNYYGDGMEPELESGQTLVVLRTQKVKEGDIIAFYYNNKVLVRRVICTGGKYLSVAEDGVVSVNGQELDEPYVSDATRGLCDISFPFSVPAAHVFVMGDSRAIAMDSRLELIGTIPEDRIIGKVILAI